MIHDPAPRRPLSTGERLGAFFVTVVIFGLFTADLMTPYEPRKLAFPLILAFWVPALVVHECGHAFVAKLLGWRVTEMVLGVGPELGRFRVGETRVVLRALPVEGYVRPSPTSPERARLANALVYLGGPGAELVVAGLIVAAVGWPAVAAPDPDLGVLALHCFTVALLTGAILNSIPHRLAGAPNDGLGILISARLPREYFVHAVAAPAQREADALLQRGDVDGASEVVERAITEHPDNPHLAMHRVVVRAHRGDVDGAMEELEALRETAPRDATVEAELLHTAARIALVGRDATLQLYAAQAVTSATRIAGLSPSYAVTLGALYAELERLEEAFESLQFAYKHSRDPVIEDQAVAYLALVTRDLGREEDHARFLAELERRGTYEDVAARARLPRRTTPA